MLGCHAIYTVYIPTSISRSIPLVLQFRFGDKPLNFQVVFPQNGTTVLKELSDIIARSTSNQIMAPTTNERMLLMRPHHHSPALARLDGGYERGAATTAAARQKLVRGGVNSALHPSSRVLI